MATRAATFTAKIRTLYDYHLRTVHNILPLPSGIDIANTLKYFSQTLLGVLRDVPTLSMEMMKSRDCDHARMSLFPNLDYKGLYYAVVQLVDIVPMIQYGTAALGYAILFSLACLVPFLEHEYMDTLPYLVASSMAMFPSSLHKDIIDMLCNHLLPFTVTQTEPDNQNYASLSTASIIMLVFQYTENTAFHCQLLECLMSWKADVLRDLLCVIAHGTPNSRAPAANLLFYYWPSLNPALHDRRGIHLKVSGWKPLTCQRDNCLSPVNNEVVKMLLDHSIAIGCGDHPPPVYICQDCADQIKREQPSANICDVLLPLQQISMTCENKSCRSSDKTAVSTCFSIDCASYNGNHPIRYCSQCHSIRHNNRRGGDHVFHSTVASPWSMDPDTQGYMVEAIVSLLQEAQPSPDRRLKESDDRHPRVALLLDNELNLVDASQLEERRLLSRYGIYLLVGLCTPNEDTPVETLGRLLGMLFQWFDALAYLPDDQAGNTLERLKSEYIHGWLMDVCRTHFEVFVSCLLPHPVEYARVGGHWDTLANRTSHIKEGFNRLFCLVPYEIISLEVWDYIMPYWLEAIRHEVPEEEMSELRVLLSKVLDPEMSPLGFDAHQMYRFISIRFHNTTPPVQEQALFWLQVLSMLNVVIPLSLLFTMFNDGVKASSSPPTGPPAEGAKVLHASKDELTTGSGLGAATVTEDSRANSPFSSDEHPASHVVDTKTDSEVNLTCFILMLDILLKQLELQEVDPHQGMEHIVSRESLALIEDMVRCPWVGTHTCKDNTAHDCVGCELATTFYQLSLEVIAYISPVMEIRKAEVPDETEVVGSDESSRRGSPSDEQFPLPSIQTADLPMFSRELDGQEFGVQQVFTATVQTVLDTELDTVAIMPTEEVVKAVARAVTLTETDVGLAKVSVALPTIVDENDQQQPAGKDAPEEDGTFWHTSQGKFKFTVEELPPQLQLLYSLLKHLSKYENADVLYHVLCCLKLLCLHAECLSRAAKENRGFLIWCQENLLISNLWKLVQAEYSHISQVCVEILEHCITLPSGADIFWKIIEENFHNKEWTVRSSAVEKVTMIARFVEWEPVKQSLSLQSSLANAFCYLISSMDDINPTVAQKAMLCLETIKDSSLKCLCWCLEVQFDTVIMDRPMILQTLYQLYNRLSDRKILSWEFFLNRFDALFLEAQVSLERSGEIAYPRDLRNTDMSSEIFMRKLNRAHEALNLTHSDSVRSLSASLGAKLRYKRAMSAPGGMIARQEKIVDKEKLFSRQSSAPVLKRKCSKFGIAQVVGQLPNHLFPDGNLKEPQQEENSFLNMLHRVMEMNDSDKDTLHLLVFLFMQFLSRADHAYPSDEKATAKVQNIVLRHLNVLLGYNPQDRGFCIPPYRLRSSPVFNAFLFSLPCVLDHNFRMGNLLLTTCLPLLQYCPSPQRNASEIQYPNYSLWYLEPYARHSWLMSVLTFIYKYRYSSLPLSRQVQGLIRIVLSTLDAQDHKCHHLPDGCLLTTPNTSRSRDLSNILPGDLQHGPERESPPHSPGLAMDSSRVTVSYQAEAKVVYQKTDTQEETESVTFDDIYSTEPTKPTDRSDWGQPWKPRKLPDYSFSEDVDDAEPELEAIPESPKSENSVPDSLQGSLGELATFQEATVEKARVRVETGISPGEEGVLVVNPPLEQAVKAVTSPLAAGPVESQMAHQLEAFHESFDRGRRVEVGELMTATVTVVQAEPFSPRVCQMEHVGSAEPATVSMSHQEMVLSSTVVTHLSPVPTSAGNNLNVITKRPPLKTARSFSYESKSMHSDVKDKPKIAGNGTDVTLLCPTDVSLEKSPSLVEPKVKAKAKLQRSRTLDSSSLPVSTGKPEPSKKLEVLDARQLEQSIRRREPAVISQCEQQLPQQPLTQSQYVFQPIQSHPITGRPESNDKQRPEYKSSHPIKVEPRRSPGIDGKDPTTSPTPTFSPTLPWTIEVHSAIKLEPLPPVSKPERLIAASQTMKTPEKVEPTSSRRRINRMGSLARTDSLTVDMGDSHEFHKTTPDTSAKASIGADESQQAPHGVTPSEFQFDLPSSERSSAVGYGSRDTEITGQTVKSFHQWTPKLDKQTEEHADSLKEVTITVAQSDVTSGTDNVLFSKCDSLIPVSLQLLPTVGKSLPNQGAVTGILDTLRVEKVPVIPAQVHIQMHVAHGDSSTASTSLQRVSCGPSVAVQQYNLGGRSPYPGRSLTRVTSIPEEMTIPHEVYVPSTPGLIPASHLTVAKLTVEEETYHLPPTKLVVGEATSIQAPKGQSQLAIPGKTHLQPDTSLQLQKKSTGSCLGDQPRFMQRSMSVDIPDTHLLPPVEEEPKTATRNQRTEAGAPLMSPLPPSAKSPAKGFSSFHSLSDPGGPHAFHRVDTSAPASHRQLSGFITADHRPPPAKPDSSYSSQMLMQEARPTPGWATEARVIEPKTVHLDEIRPAASVVQVHQARVITAGETVVEEQQFLESFEQEDLRQPSPKRLVKQSHITDTDLQHQSSGSTEAPSMDGPDEEGGSSLSEPQPLMDQEDQKGRPHFRQKRQRKLGISSADLQKIIDQRNNVNRKSRKGESIAQPPPKSTVVPPSALRCGEDAVVERCPECGAVLEQYTDEELALCVVILATFVHREPALAAPTLPEILRTVARIASMTMYAWQHETNVYLPGGASSVAKQFLRCVLHQLAPNGIFLQIFQSNIDVDGSFFKTVASALTDFNELNPVAPLQLLLEGLNDSKVLPLENIPQIMENIANYMTCLPLETASSAWTNILPQFDSFFRKLYLILPGQPLDVVSTFKIMASILKIPGLNGFKSILDPFSKMLSFAIQNWNIVYQTLLDICHLCNRAFIKERDKLVLSRTVVFELVQALKFKSSISDDNLLMLVQFVVQDAGGTLGPSMIVEDLVAPVMDVQNMINTNACECMRQHLNDALDFVADVHTLSKVKSNFKGTLMGLNEDTLGATLKAGIAQYLALEITRGNSRDNRTIGRYLPWLYNPPTAVQQGPKEFLDCVAHMRLLSWLLLGALTHTAMLGTNSNLVCQPIPLEASCHVADHIQIILTGFAEQSKASVLHMSSLFHAFILCQLWTMYCEQMASLNPPGSEHHNAASITLTDFWAKITPGILQLLSHSKVLAEMVNLHFLSLMEALLECNSTVLAKLFPMWSPVLNADLCQLPGHLQVRLQACEDWMPPTQTKDELTSNTSTLLKWLQRLQFKMGQIELQSSAATQFYSV